MKKTLLLIPLLLISSLSILPMEIPRVHASVLTGEACFGDPTMTPSTAPCSSTAPVFAGPNGLQIRVGVFIQGSNGTNTFDVTLLANDTYLKPYGVDLANSVLQSSAGSPQIVLECLDGRLISGPTCSASTDTLGTLHLAVAAAIGSGLTPSPTTGILFTAIYNVTGVVPPGGVSLGFQKGCTQTSVSDTTCVTLAGGSTALPEIVQLGTKFDNSASATQQFARLSTNATSFGPEFPGVTNHANITALAKNGYMINSTDFVQFTTASTPGLAVSLTSTVCSSGGASCSIILSLYASSVGNYSVTVFGTFPTVDASGRPDTLVSAVTIGLVAFDFAASISPLSVSFISGEIATITATVSSLNGFSGPVTLSTGICRSGGKPCTATSLTITYSPNPVVLTPGSKVNSTITFHSSITNTTTITFLARIVASANGRSKILPSPSTAITINVSPPVPDYYFVATPSRIGPQEAGAFGTSTLSVIYVNGFNAPVTLTVPTSSSYTASLNLTSVTGNHNVTLTASSQTANNYAITVTGLNGTTPTPHRTITITLSVFDFNLAAAPTLVKAVQGTSALSSITVISLNGFGGTVSLTNTPPPGLTATLTPTMVTGSGLAILNVTSSLTLSPANYTVVVKGVSGGLTHSATITVTVTPLVPDFALLATTPPSVFMGQFANSTITVSPKNGFSGTVSLTLSIVPTTSGLMCSLSASGVTPSSDSTLQCHSASTGTSIVTVTGKSGSLTHFANIPVNVWDFNFTSPTSQVSIYENSTTTVTMSLGSENGFDGTIGLTGNARVFSPTTFVGSPPTISLGSPSIHLTANARMTVTVTITIDKTVKPEVFGVFVNATSGIRMLSQLVSVTVLGPGISISSSPASIVVGPGSTGHSVITFTSVNGLYGLVTLSLTNPSGATCTLDSLSITLTKGSPQAHTGMTCTGSAGSHTVTINAVGTDPGGAQITAKPSGTVDFVVADFTISAMPTGPLINTGVTGHARISISWNNGFSGDVTLQLVQATGLTASLESSSLHGSGNITIDFSSNTANAYSLVVNATSGNVSHTVTLTVTVSPVEQAPTIFGLDPTLFYSITGVAVVVVIGGIVALIRRRKS